MQIRTVVFDEVLRLLPYFTFNDWIISVSYFEDLLFCESPDLELASCLLYFV